MKWLRGNAIGIAGVVLTASFFLAWVGVRKEVSGFDIARSGGWRYLLFAIPVMGALAAHAGFTRADHMSLVSLGAALAVVVPLLGFAAWHAPGRVQLLLAVGVLLLVCGLKNTAKELALPVGLVLVAVFLYVWLTGPRSSGSTRYSLDFLHITNYTRFQVLFAAMYGLIGLMLAVAAATVWMVVAGLLKRGERAAMIATGGLILAAFVYAIFLAVYAATATLGQEGLWGTLLATIVLLVFCLGGAPKQASTPTVG